MTDAMLFAIGCGVTFIFLAGARAYARSTWVAASVKRDEGQTRNVA